MANGLIPCGEIIAPTPCGTVPEPNVCGGVRVCGVDYSTVEKASQLINIPPHWIRFMASTPAHPDVYYL